MTGNSILIKRNRTFERLHQIPLKMCVTTTAKITTFWQLIDKVPNFIESFELSLIYCCRLAFQMSAGGQF
jgi:hypothetical protein